MNLRLLSIPTFTATVLVAGLNVACDDLEPPNGDYDAGYEPPVIVDAGPDAAPFPMNGAHVVHTPDGDAILTKVNAIDYVLWVYLDLDTGLEVDETDARWDIRLRRFEIALNGGASGTGGVEVAIVPAPTLESVTAAPTEGYVTDTGPMEGLAFATWYRYDEMTHILTPEDRVYVVRTTTGATVAVEMTGYYNGAGTSGNPAFRWKPIATATP